jgi:preprotein translocase subunit YajC
VTFVIVLVAMMVFMYFLLIRPQQAQKRRTQDMLAKLAPGDEVITIGGIYGDVVEVHDEKVVLEIAEDVLIEITRRAVANIVPPESQEDEPVEGEEPEDAEADGGKEGGDVEEPVAEAESETPAEVEERTK